jgi:hypothetical protein
MGWAPVLRIFEIAGHMWVPGRLSCSHSLTGENQAVTVLVEKIVKIRPDQDL